jgi:Holliday junction resolvase RusA-like endonuclease
MTLTILGAPRTKKTSNRVVRVKGRTVVLPSKANETWARAAVLQLRTQWRRPHGRIVAIDGKRGIVTMDSSAAPWRSALACRAMFYRDANRGDLIGYMQALADALEAAGIVENDRLIVSWDGTRMLTDKANPRVEVELTPA